MAAELSTRTKVLLGVVGLAFVCGLAGLANGIADGNAALALIGAGLIAPGLIVFVVDVVLSRRTAADERGAHGD